MKRWSMAGAWLVVVVLATTLTWQIVSAADDRVSDRPAPLNLAAPVITDLETTTSSIVDASSTSSATVPRESPTTTTSATTSTSGPKPGPTTSSSVATTTSTAVSWQTELVQTAGGAVTLRYRPGEVVYQSATPAPGFQVEVDHAGPPEVEVEFESESSKIEVHASWRDGALDVDVSGSGED